MRSLPTWPRLLANRELRPASIPGAKHAFRRVNAWGRPRAVAMVENFSTAVARRLHSMHEPVECCDSSALRSRELNDSTGKTELDEPLKVKHVHVTTC
jgi:hypothetical protein